MKPPIVQLRVLKWRKAGDRHKQHHARGEDVSGGAIVWLMREHFRRLGERQNTTQETAINTSTTKERTN